MKHFKLKWREEMKGIGPKCLVKKTSNQAVMGELTYWLAFRRRFGKKSNDITRDTYSIQDNQFFF